MQRVTAICELMLIATAMSHLATAADPPPGFQVELGVRQLFLDDVGLERVEGLRRVVNPPQRHPENPVVRPDQPWEDRCQVYGTAMYDEEAGLFKLWYLTTPRDRALRPLDLGGGRVRAPHTTLAAYAFSQDGIRWAKPALEQFPYDGDTRNNLLDLGVNNCEGISVLYDAADADRSRRWKCIYWDHGSGGFELRDGKPYCKPGPDDGLCVAFSADGLVWRPLRENPVLRVYSDTNQNLLFDMRRKQYVAFGRFGLGRRIARSESTDCVHWSEPRLVMECDEADGPGTQYYGAGVDIYEGVYVAMLWLYREGGDAKIDTQLATSRDGIHWTRVGERATWLALGDDDSWEGGMVRSVERIIVRGDELYVYYCGVHGPHGRPGHPPVERRHRTAIGLLTLRRDGFISMDAGDEGGWLMTRPFVPPAGRIFVNAQVEPGGEIRATMCDADAVPIAGLERSGAIQGDVLSAPLVWPQPRPAELSSRSLRLRFTMKRAKLYAYWFEP